MLRGSGADMLGKVVVITGATSGIGQVAAEKLARMGARIVQVARDGGRGEAAFARLQEIAPGVAHRVHHADLSRLAEMKRVGAEIAAAEPRIDVLINNAGAVFGTRHVTEDGLERTFALNHMSYFVMTALLRERLLATTSARIVNTASGRHRKGRLDFSDLQGERRFQGLKAYANSKLCNVLFTRALARRLAATGVTANCLHPGFVATRFGDQAGGLYAAGIRLAKLSALTPEQGAETLIYLASSPEVAGQSGGYYGKCRLETPSAGAQDDAAAEQLWAESERIAGISFPRS
jgi:NAD(P)-dependent dehydrogenase (short-subunit alcohol dehydrogenase family)